MNKDVRKLVSFKTIEKIKPIENKMQMLLN